MSDERPSAADRAAAQLAAARAMPSDVLLFEMTSYDGNPFAREVYDQRKQAVDEEFEP